MRWIEVTRTDALKGSLEMPGSKNSSLALLAACCLSEEPVTLYKIPDISDVRMIYSILTDIGAKVIQENGKCVIDPRGIQSGDIRSDYASAYRASYYFIGALLAKHKRVAIGYPGGDNFVSRPIDQHIKGLKALGARIEYFKDHYVVQAEKLVGATIYFDCITGGATLNIMMAAALAQGKTVLHNAARDPEVVDTAILLNKMGAKIYGAGTDVIRIQGVDALGGCDHTVIPDRLIAGAYLMAAGATGGEVTVNNIIPEHLEACMDKLREIGMEFSVSENAVTAWAPTALKPTRVRTGKYPILESDFQQPMTALLLKAEGRSMVADKIYPLRFNHCEQLARMGASITVRSGAARIDGGKTVTGAWVHAGDIRAGICLVLAGLMAEGTTFLTGIEHIERGYEDIIGDFDRLGAKLRMSSSEGTMEELFSGSAILRTY